MSKIEDGGPAFPVPEGNRLSDGSDCNEGMSLRNYFAGQALIGIGTWMPNGTSCDLTDPDAMLARAEWAYAQADAMLKARKGGAE